MVTILGIIGIVLFILMVVSGSVNQGGFFLGFIIFIGAIIAKGFPEGLLYGGMINLFIDLTGLVLGVFAMRTMKD